MKYSFRELDYRKGYMLHPDQKKELLKLDTRYRFSDSDKHYPYERVHAQFIKDTKRTNKVVVPAHLSFEKPKIGESHGKVFFSDRITKGQADQHDCVEAIYNSLQSEEKVLEKANGSKYGYRKEITLEETPRVVQMLIDIANSRR